MTDNGGLRQLPKGWAWTTLEEIRSDRGQARDPRRTPKETFELYSVPSFDCRAPEICKGGEIGSSKRTVEPGTVLLCKINPRINRVWIVGQHSPWPKVASTEWIPFFPQAEVEARYLSYFMQRHAFRDYLASHVSGVGGSLMRVRPAVLSSCGFPLCPLPEQRRIAGKIDEIFTQLDAGVEALHKVKAQLRRYRQAVLKAAFEGRLTEEWRGRRREGLTSVPAAPWHATAGRTAGGDACDLSSESLLPELPAAWRWARVGDVLQTLQYGTSVRADARTEDGVPMLRMGNIRDGRIETANLKYLDRRTEGYQKYLLEDGDVLVNRTNSAELVGKTALFRGDGEFVFASYLIRLRVEPARILPDYLVLVMNSDIGRQHVARTRHQVAGQANINSRDIREMPVPLPILAEQGEIVAEAERRFSLADDLELAIEQGLKRAERLRQSILKRAFEGKLVPQDPADEPAAVLLERIRGVRSTKVAKGREGREGTRRGRGRRKGEAKQERLL